MTTQPYRVCLLLLTLTCTRQNVAHSDPEGSSSTANDAATEQVQGDTVGDSEAGRTTHGEPHERTEEGSSETDGSECGNGAIEDGEECDLGIANADNGPCTSQCRTAFCGDGFLRFDTEECDPGEETAACNRDCTTARCGDGHVNLAAGEVCDGPMPHADCLECLDVKCHSGFGHCNGDPADGCETNLRVDASCGACGQACESTSSCTEQGCARKRLVFTSSETYSGNLGGLPGADAKCQALAQSAHLPGPYMAWLANGVESPNSRMNRAFSVFISVDAAVRVDGWTALAQCGTVWPTERGEEPSRRRDGDVAGLFRWSGIRGGGPGGGADCENWSTDSVSKQGMFNCPNDRSRSGMPCNQKNHLLCVQQ